MTSLTQEFIFSAMDAEAKGEVFPINLSEVFRSAGYSRERDAARRLGTSRLVEGVDYVKSKFSDALRESMGGRPSNKINLSVDGYKSFLLAANTDEGEEARRYFIEVEKRYRKQLESLFNSELDDRQLLINALNNAESEVLTLQQQLEYSQLESAKLKADFERSIGNHLDFSYSLDMLHQNSGIVNKTQVKQAIVRDFIEGDDYIFVDNKIFVNQQIYQLLMTSFRSKVGANTSTLPETISFKTVAYFKYRETKLKNRRLSQRECEGQLDIQFPVQKNEE